MSMFPGPGASIIRNEAGEPVGWDYPAEDDPWEPDHDDDGDRFDVFVEELLERHEECDESELGEIHRLMQENGIDDPCVADDLFDHAVRPTENVPANPFL